MTLYTVYGITVPQSDLEIYKKERNCGCPVVNESFEFCPHCGNKMWSTKRKGLLYDENTMKWGDYDVVHLYEQKLYFVGIILGTLDTKGSCCYVPKYLGRNPISLMKETEYDLNQRYPNNMPSLCTFIN